MYNRFINKDGLQDKEIVKALSQSVIDYKNGEISEVQETLEEIVWAIHVFDELCKENGGAI